MRSAACSAAVPENELCQDINGVRPKVTQELAGHYSSQISMDIYTHVNMDSKREAVAAVASVF